MATLSMSSSNGIAYFTISGLTANNYLDVGVATSAADGTQMPPSGICYSNGATSTPPTSVSGSFNYGQYGTFTFYGYGETSDGVYWPAGSATITITKPPFAWDVAKTVGSSTITASEWNGLINYIADAVGYFSADYATIGYFLTAEMYNQLINAMGASSSYLVSAGQPITAAKLNLLVTLANNL